MKSESKLAPVRDTIQKLNLQHVLHSARRVLEHTAQRWSVRPLRDVDGWSDQAEVAFYEECQARRA